MFSDKLLHILKKKNKWLSYKNDWLANDCKRVDMEILNK